eukprot:TRINITY_DN101159_c0_g1_i1.p1 TRINITY_DN101159_c0_g1~~TRINITY_DN101159_c0_g1_i1.p1  ORF type:complete len:487 (-),score=89.45 TRINITY_DN101159_c0_g1_i1:170-1630(-)
MFARSSSPAPQRASEDAPKTPRQKRRGPRAEEDEESLAFFDSPAKQPAGHLLHERFRPPGIGGHDTARQRQEESRGEPPWRPGGSHCRKRAQEGLHGDNSRNLSLTALTWSNYELKTQLLAAAASGENVGDELFVGFRSEGGFRDGFGVQREDDGSMYVGQWSQGKRHGHGALFFPAGVFEGEWQSGSSHGKGAINFYNGDVFAGLFRRSKKHGFGYYKWRDGALEEGKYESGQKTGWHSWSRGRETNWDLLYTSGRVLEAWQRGPGEPSRLSLESLAFSRHSLRSRSPSPSLENSPYGSDCATSRGRSQSPSATTSRDASTERGAVTAARGSEGSSDKRSSSASSQKQAMVAKLHGQAAAAHRAKKEAARVAKLEAARKAAAAKKKSLLQKANLQPKPRYMQARSPRPAREFESGHWENDIGREGTWQPQNQRYLGWSWSGSLSSPERTPSPARKRTSSPRFAVAREQAAAGQAKPKKPSTPRGV